jgi:purine-binding chemotaxis protein CheW
MVSDESLALHDPDAGRAREEITAASFFVLELAGRRYALAPACVEEVTPPQRPLPIPTVPRHFLGVIHLRGRILPLVDGRRVLGLEDAEVAADESARLVVLCVSGQRWAVMADRVLGMREVRADHVTDRDAELPASGRFELPEGQVVVLDAAALTQVVRTVRS